MRGTITRGISLVATVAAVAALSPGPAGAATSFTVELQTPATIEWDGYEAQTQQVELEIRNRGAAADTYVVTKVDEPAGIPYYFNANTSPTPGLALDPGESGTTYVWIGAALSSPHGEGVDPAGGDYDYTIHIASSVGGEEETVDVTIARTFPTLTDSATVMGRVTTASGAAISGAEVWLKDRDLQLVPSEAETDADGNYSVRVSPGTYVVGIDAVGYTSSITDGVAITTGPNDRGTTVLEDHGISAGSTTPSATVEVGHNIFRGHATPDLSLIAVPSGFPSQENGDMISAVDGNAELLWQETLARRTSQPTQVSGLTSHDPAVAVAADGSKVAVATNTGEFRMYDASGDAMWSTTTRSSDVNPLVPGDWGEGIIYGTAVAFSPDDSEVAFGSVTGWVYVFDAGSGELRWMTPTGGEVRALRFSEDGSRLVASPGDKQLYMLDAADGSVIWQRDVTFFSWHNIGMTADGSRVAVAGKDGAVFVYSRSGALLYTRSFGVPIANITYTPDGAHLIISSDLGLFDLDESFDLRWYRPDQNSQGMQFDVLTDSGRFIVLGLPPATPGIQVLDLDGTLLWSYQYPTANAYVRFARMSDDGSKLVAAVSDGSDGKLLFFDDVLSGISDEPDVYSRSLTLRLSGHLTAKGTLSVDEGPSRCIANRTITVQKKRSTGWKRITTTRTGTPGSYSVSIPDQSGRYRTKTARIEVSGGAICAAAKSSTKLHSH